MLAVCLLSLVGFKHNLAVELPPVSRSQPWYDTEFWCERYGWKQSVTQCLVR